MVMILVSILIFLVRLFIVIIIEDKVKKLIIKVIKIILVVFKFLILIKYMMNFLFVIIYDVNVLLIVYLVFEVVFIIEMMVVLFDRREKIGGSYLILILVLSIMFLKLFSVLII